MDQPIESLRRLLASGFPITRHLGLAVSSYEGGCLTLECRLEGNRNQHDTAFAGTLNAAATLAGWGQLWLILSERGVEAQIVLQSSAVEYLRPVTGDFVVECCRPEAGAISRLFTTLGRRGKGRLELPAEVFERGRRAVSFVGRYVATVL